MVDDTLSEQLSRDLAALRLNQISAAAAKSFTLSKGLPLMDC
jgi:hypothetical protein